VPSLQEKFHWTNTTGNTYALRVPLRSVQRDDQRAIALVHETCLIEMLMASFRSFGSKR